MKKLCITGFSRSGTTALTDLLNLDPRIKVTYEKKTFTNRDPNRRRKWDDRNKWVESLEKAPVYEGDKTTRPYLADFGKIQKQADKIIFCLRDPRDIFRSKYWDLIDESPVEMYVKLMGHVLEYDLSNICFVRYEWAVLHIEALAEKLADYLGLDRLDISGHNYKPVRRFGWKKGEAPELPGPVRRIMSEFGYENTIWGMK